MPILIQREELADAISAHVVLAVSPVGHGSNDAAHAEFIASHIPGARLAYGAVFSRDPLPGEGRNPLPHRAVLEESVRALGLELTDSIVLYDSFKSAWASRAWWVLTNVGFEDVRILDGGLPHWSAGGLPVEEGPVSPVRSGTVLDDVDRLVAYDADQVAAHPAHGLLIDARDARRFAGEAHPTLDPRGGHIPGAANLPWQESVGPDGRFLPADQLRAKLEALGVTDDMLTVNYCGSGVSAAFTIVTEVIAGYSNVGLYPGSWSEWAADRTRPVEVVDA